MWMKHWFVLRGTTLSLYKDTAAEDNNVLDDVIELNRAQRVEECETEKNYGFQIIVGSRTFDPCSRCSFFLFATQFLGLFV